MRSDMLRGGPISGAAPLAEQAPADPHGGDAGTRSAQPGGGFASIEGEEYYRISAIHRMPPFLMNIASDTDLWMFISSRGGLTAGRVSADGALFPYETVDRLHDGHHHTGPVTLLRIHRNGAPPAFWEPFREDAGNDDLVERNLYKNAAGNRLVFEEVRHDLALAFRYRWSASDDFGLVRTAWLSNEGAEPVAISMLDGLRNVLPFNAPLPLMQRASTLVDAYKQVDCDPGTRLGIFSLTSGIVDRPEAAEELRANTVWCRGLAPFSVRLSLDAVAAFRRGEPLQHESRLAGQRGNYLVVASLELQPRARAKWHLVGDVGLDHLRIARLEARLRDTADIDGAIEDSLAQARDNLLRNVGSADGLQRVDRPEETFHHIANVLFNNMRGGVLARNYQLPAADFAEFTRIRNRVVAGRHAALLRDLPAEMALADLAALAERTGDAGFERLAHEYLPLFFGRRHGDPSRPWNRFEIRLRNPDGSRALRYEGNWRDLFQNWEALAASFPGALPGMIAKFVNASTVDGFNPYRITRDGIEWEVSDPNDPWSHIGYWGDHQVVYLLRLLEPLTRAFPGTLERMLDREIFCYAEVPYRLRPYARMVEDPRATIDYDVALASRIDDRVREMGTDGRLLHAPDGTVYHVNLLEKLLVPALSKLSNFVPGGGIWMNTQRPEWNDANNALVGYGVSAVTLCHLRRYLHFLEGVARGRREARAAISSEVAAWLRNVHHVLESNRALLITGVLDPRERKAMVDLLGEAFSDYRETVYEAGLSGREELSGSEIAAFCRLALEFVDHAIAANRRDDGLYHSYHLLEPSPDGRELSLRDLHEMLEGQVAALSSGVVEPAEALRLVTSLFGSRLYRSDQRSFVLYPERELPAFVDRNVIPARRIDSVALLRELVAAGESTLVARDVSGIFRFHGEFRNQGDVAAALERLAREERWRAMVSSDRGEVLAVFEEVFRHRSFMGRADVMYGYEGLGCVYWHMVSKLLLAVQEIILRSDAAIAPDPVRRGLARAYYRIRAGLGFEKSVTEYGAFPTDPYSHTPRHAGAQQPGMTGQVKEEILTRFGELGVGVKDGMVRFRPVLLRRSEFLRQPGTYRCHDLEGRARSLEIAAGSLAFSVCQVPVVYQLTADRDGSTGWIRVACADGTRVTRTGDRLDAELSRTLLERTGRISRIDVGIPEGLLFDHASGEADGL